MPKGLNLLVDIQVSPVLNLVLVDGGSLIFADDRDDSEFEQTFDANVIFVKDGLIQAGTQDDPF